LRGPQDVLHLFFSYSEIGLADIKQSNHSGPLGVQGSGCALERGGIH
jgi:hypothetical protein